MNHYSLQKLLWVSPVVGVFTITLNLVIYYLAYLNKYWPDEEMVMINGSHQRLNHLAVIYASFIPALAGGILFAILVRISSRPVRIFVFLGISLTIVSLLVPFNVDQLNLSNIMIMDIMHIVAAMTILSLIPMLSRIPTETADVV